MSKAWGTPGAYAIKVEKGVFPSGTVRTSVVVKDVMKGLCASLLIARRECLLSSEVVFYLAC